MFNYTLKSERGLIKSLHLSALQVSQCLLPEGRRAGFRPKKKKEKKISNFSHSTAAADLKPGLVSAGVTVRALTFLFISVYCVSPTGLHNIRSYLISCYSVISAVYSLSAVNCLDFHLGVAVNVSRQKKFKAVLMSNV